MGDSAAMGEMLEVKEITLERLRSEGGALVEANWIERLGPGPSRIDWSQYEMMARAGILVIVAAWRGATMVGYAAAATIRSLNTGQGIAEGLVVYVSPPARGGLVWAELVQRVMQTALATFDPEPARPRWHVEAGDPLSSLLERLGYRVTEEVYSR